MSRDSEAPRDLSAGTSVLGFYVHAGLGYSQPGWWEWGHRDNEHILSRWSAWNRRRYPGGKKCLPWVRTEKPGTNGCFDFDRWMWSLKVFPSDGGLWAARVTGVLSRHQRVPLVPSLHLPLDCTGARSFNFYFCTKLDFFWAMLWTTWLVLLLCWGSTSGERPADERDETAAEARTDSRRQRSPPPVEPLDFGFVPAAVYDTHAYYEPGPVGILFHMVHAFLYVIQPNAFPKGEILRHPLLLLPPPSFLNLSVIPLTYDLWIGSNTYKITLCKICV